MRRASPFALPWYGEYLPRRCRIAPSSDVAEFHTTRVRAREPFVSFVQAVCGTPPSESSACPVRHGTHRQRLPAARSIEGFGGGLRRLSRLDRTRPGRHYRGISSVDRHLYRGC